MAARSLGAGGGLEAVELAIRTAMTRLGGGLLEDLLGLDAGHRGPRVDCGAGHAAEFVSYREKTVDTVLGPVRVNRAWYHCAACGHGMAPKDAELGVTGTSMSPGLAKMTARAAAMVPFARAAGLLSELAGIDLTVKRVERSAEATGTAAAAANDAETDAIRAREVVPVPPPFPAPDMLYIAVDGTGVPMVAAETRGRTGKGEDGRARTREVKLACLFTQTTVDDDGRPVRDPGSSSYLATFEPAERFGQLLDAEARRRGASHIRQLTVLGDGAAWIWNIAGELFPAATQIVDLYHAREHVHDLAALATRLLRGSQPDWLARRLDELDAGDIPALLAAGRDLNFIGSLAAERDKQLGYFENNAHRMRYTHFRSLGMFVGSGVVEAGCKAVIGQRLKLSGMRWTIPGAASIATLRCQDASNRWEQIWQRPHYQTTPARTGICQQDHTQTAAG
ncbi:MAG TPA: ISKra4 family transposase [Streptosporangiaceae bacterium]|nr:ISKra4 family transposase [Streptosporangiaceae bacterium]